MSFKLWIRVDASKQIGTGHVYRCLSVARELGESGITSIFVCRSFEGNLIDLIKSSGFEVVSLNSKLPLPESICDKEIVEVPLKHSEWLNSSQFSDFTATQQHIAGRIKSDDWLLIDHFALDAFWESRIQSMFNCKLIAIDGQADRAHQVDYLIDPNVCSDKHKWDGLIGPKTILKQGLNYIPLAKPFEKKLFRVKTHLQHVLISFGGVDNNDFTQQSLKSLINLPLTFDVVVGKNYPNLESLESFCETHEQVCLHVQTDRMVDLMSEADLSVGAGGTMVWERCMAALPSLVTSIADNQCKQLKCVEELGIGKLISNTDYAQNLKQQVEVLLSDTRLLNHMSKNAYDLSVKRSCNAWTDLLQKN